MSSANRIANTFLFRQAGILQVPPALHKAILDWIYAYVASREIQSKERILESRPNDDPRSKAIAELQEGVNRLRANPADWGTYKDVYESMWVFGHPGTRWSVKDFQKLTPERRENLIRQINRKLDSVQENIDREKSLKVTL